MNVAATSLSSVLPVWIVLSAGVSSGRINEPVPLGPIGAEASSLVVHLRNANEILLASQGPVGSEHSNLLRSADGGATFLPEPGEGATTSLFHDPLNSEGLYALRSVAAEPLSREVAHSADFGRSWTSLTPTNHRVDVLSVASNGDLLAAGRVLYSADRFLLRSVDGGRAWSPAPSAEPFDEEDVRAMAHAPGDPGVVYAMVDPAPLSTGSYDDESLYKSADGGDSFSAVANVGENLDSIVIHPGSSDELILIDSIGPPIALRSTDGGLSFVPMPDPGFGSGLSMQWDPDGVRLWAWASEESLAWCSTDAGQSWSAVSFVPTPNGLGRGPMAFDSDGNRWFPVRATATSHEHDDVYFMPAGNPSSWSGLGVTGRHMRDVHVGVDGTRFARPLGVGPYVAAPGEAFASLTPAVDHEQLTAFAVSPADATEWLVGVSYPTTVFGGFSNALATHVYFDSGAASVQSRGYDGLSSDIAILAEFAYDPRTPSRVIRTMVGTSDFTGEAVSDVSYSSDGGLSWTKSATPSGGLGVIPRTHDCTAFDPHTAGRVVVLGRLPDGTPSPAIAWVESTDGGRTFGAPMELWPLASSDPSADGIGAVSIAFDPHSPGVVYAGDNENGLRCSADDGTSWTSLGVDLSYRSDILVHPELPGLLWVTDRDGGVLVSTDFGVGFCPASNLQGNLRAGPLAADPTDGSLLVGTERVSVWELPHASPYVSIGEGTEGAAELVPRHYALGGFPRSGASLNLAGDRLLGGATVVLGIGLSQIAVPLLGGTLYAGPPAIDLLSFPSAGILGAPGAGTFLHSVPVPTNPTLVGVAVVSQFAAIDDAGPEGFAFSNGLRTTILP